MQNVLLLGKGISNNALHQFMIKYNINHDYLELEEVNNYDYNLVIKAPGINYQESVIQNFILLKKTIITDIEFIYWFLNREYIAVTATVGKTTTVMLIEQIINTTFSAVACGNIGYPLAQAALDYKKYQYYVLELSSFQLKGTINFAPKIAVILNIDKHHLDYHQTYEDYIEAKSKITVNQTATDFLVYNIDDIKVNKIAAESNAKKITFSLTDKNADAYFYHKTLYFRKEPIYKFHKCSLGMQYDLLAAVCVAKILKINSIKIRQAIMHFKPPKYRLEPLGNRIYNDAKSTSVLATITALKSFKKQKIFLICGGYDRKEDYHDLTFNLSLVTKVFVYGETKDKLKDFFSELKIEVYVFDTLKKATLMALDIRKKETILFSPMHASYDQYQSFNERGKEFRLIVDEYYQKR